VTAGKYKLQGSYKSYSDKIMSEPIEIEILEGKASHIKHTWQSDFGQRSKSHLVYWDDEKIMHQEGYSHNLEVIDYNYSLSEEVQYKDFTIANSAYDKNDFGVWIIAAENDKLVGNKIKQNEIIAELDSIKLSGTIVLDAIVENSAGLLIIPETISDKKKHWLVFHIFDSEGKKKSEKKIEVGKDTRVYCAEDLRATGYLLIYGFAGSKKYEIHSVSAVKPEMSDIKNTKLYESSQEFETIVIPPTYDVPQYVYAVTFEEKSKSLWLYNIGLNPKSKTAVPPKVVLKSQGELKFDYLALDQKGVAYMLFTEDDKKLLYYNFTDNEFRFITEEKYSEAQLIATDADGIFLIYIDNIGVIRFLQTETVMKSH